ncbi:hypothetical protein [Enterococcus timonensis]|uniref:hypothetical protein n=1 Tax=Enterococcus timonensis TaxID=1852364 RepID=UPI0008D9E650|nr:hypothetical protein [Enterococcus timonensis]
MDSCELTHILQSVHQDQQQIFPQAAFDNDSTGSTTYPQLSEVLAIWPQKNKEKRGHKEHCWVLTTSGLIEYHLSSRHAVHRWTENDDYDAVMQAINLSCGKEKGLGLKPYIAYDICLQPLSRMRDHPVWINFHHVKDCHATNHALEIIMAGGYQLTVDLSKHSFEKVRQVAGRYCWHCQQYYADLTHIKNRLTTPIFADIWEKFKGQEPMNWTKFILDGQKIVIEARDRRNFGG